MLMTGLWQVNATWLEKPTFVNTQIYRPGSAEASPKFYSCDAALGFSLAYMGNVDDAIALLESAVRTERSPENLAGLTEILAFPGEGKQGTPEQQAKAFALAKEAVARYQYSDDSSYLALTAQLPNGQNWNALKRRDVRLSPSPAAVSLSQVSPG
jgi:hypothetical protein